MIRKIAGWGFILFIAYYLMSDPTGAAGTVHSAFGLLGQAGHSAAAFVNALHG
jgi:hypothetical protein